MTEPDIDILKGGITCAFLNYKDKDAYEGLVDAQSIVSIIVPPTCGNEYSDKSRLGTFNQKMTSWEMPARTGRSLLFFGTEDRFGVKMLLSAIGGGIFCFAYMDGEGKWIYRNILFLCWEKIFKSVLSRTRNWISRCRICLLLLGNSISIAATVIPGHRFIDFLWETNLKLIYKSKTGTSPDIFLRRFAGHVFSRRPRIGKPEVVQYIGGLYPGGAERQLCNLVVGIDTKRFNVRILTYARLNSGVNYHYEDLLSRVHVNPRCAGTIVSTSAKRKILKNYRMVRLLNQLPDIFNAGTLELLGSLIDDPPDVLHAWLDQSNICAAIAGLLAGIPVIILSTRNVNPNNFHYLANPLYKPWYQALLSTGRITLINNSQAGATDYADWLDIPEETIEVIRNGVDFESLSRPDQEQITAFRKSHNVTETDKVITGVFRLSDEKRPLSFIDACINALKKLPTTQVIIAGIGPCETAMKQRVQDAGFEDSFHFLGRYNDIPLLLSSADVLLHTSRYEGTPNAVLEAQWLGCPVVATKAGGTVDAVKNGGTGILVDVDDEPAISRALLQMLTNDDIRSSYGSAGPDFIRRQFSLESMVSATVAVYFRELKARSPASKKGVLHR